MVRSTEFEEANVQFTCLMVGVFTEWVLCLEGDKKDNYLLYNRLVSKHASREFLP